MKTITGFLNRILDCISNPKLRIPLMILAPCLALVLAVLLVLPVFRGGGDRAPAPTAAPFAAPAPETLPTDPPEAIPVELTEPEERNDGWQTVDGKRVFILEDGSYAVGLQEIDGRLYYFNQNGEHYTEIKAFAMNHTAWPARVVKNLSYNYYFDISELIEQGGSIADVGVRIGYDQHSGDEGFVTISDPIQYDGNVYYVKISFNDGRVVMPTGQSEHRSECQFRIYVEDSSGYTWDASNDWSAQGLKSGGEMDMVTTPYITMYDGDTLLWGEEPDGTKPAPYTPPTPAERMETMLRHIRMILETSEKPPQLAVREARKYASWYMAGSRNAAAYRDRCYHLSDYAEAEALAAQFIRDNA